MMGRVSCTAHAAASPLTACTSHYRYHVAVAVAKHALEENLARAGPGRGESVEQWVAKKMYFPEYAPLYCE